MVKPELYKGTTNFVRMGVYENYRYYIRDGICNPCAYIAIPYGHKLFKQDYDNIDNISCHGGLTFSGELINRDGKSFEEYVIGWDYGHLGDKILTSYSEAPEFNLEGHQWTIDEIEEEIKEVIEQIKKLS